MTERTSASQSRSSFIPGSPAEAALDERRCLGALPRADPDTFVDLWRGRFGAPMVVTRLAPAWPTGAQWTRAWVLERLGVRETGDAVSRALPPSMIGAVPLPSFLEPRSTRQVNVWVAPDGYVSHLHQDLHDNLLTVIGGEKDVTLFPPSETRRLYPHAVLDHEAHPSNSQVDLDHVDVARFPQVRRARHWKVTLGPGETLYIPARFWHFVRSRGESVAVNVWFDRPDASLLERARAVPLRFRAHHLLARLARRG